MLEEEMSVIKSEWAKDLESMQSEEREIRDQINAYHSAAIAKLEEEYKASIAKLDKTLIGIERMNAERSLGRPLTAKKLERYADVEDAIRQLVRDRGEKQREMEEHIREISSKIETLDSEIFGIEYDTAIQFRREEILTKFKTNLAIELQETKAGIKASMVIQKEQHLENARLKYANLQLLEGDREGYKDRILVV